MEEATFVCCFFFLLFYLFYFILFVRRGIDPYQEHLLEPPHILYALICISKKVTTCLKDIQRVFDAAK